MPTAVEVLQKMSESIRLLNERQYAIEEEFESLEAPLHLERTGCVSDETLSGIWERATEALSIAENELLELFAALDLAAKEAAGDLEMGVDVEVARQIEQQVEQDEQPAAHWRHYPALLAAGLWNQDMNQ